MNRLVDQWFAQNNIDARWVNDKTFFIDDIRYLYLRHKIEQGENKIFSQDFAFLIDEDELEEFMTGDDHKVDFYCFEFGGKVYYSAITDKPELNLFKHLGKAKDISGFDYLGIHGGFELCSGSRTYDDWCKKAKFLGVTTLGLCEKHTLAGALKFQLACAKHKIKSIIGETINIKGKEGEYKVKVYVANEEGWKNLLRIHKRLNIDNAGKFVEEDELISRGEGLYCVLNHDTLLTDMILVEYFHAKFLGVYFQFDPVQYKAEKRDLQCLNCLKKAIEIGMPFILICDSYYLDQEDHRVKQILQFIGSVGFEYQSDNQHFKSLEDVSLQTLEMFETKGDEFASNILEQALQGLKEVSEGCEYNIELGKTKLPKYLLTQEEKDRFRDTETFFWYLIEKGLQKKVIDRGLDQETYLKRIEVEYDVISRGGFIDYFLILNDVIRWCEDQKILVGAGRGSGAGSLIAYLLDLVHVNPLEHGLIFERFLNEGRIGRSMPDLDTDIQGTRRDEVKRYIESKYGAQNVCSIGTYGTFKLKAAFRDLCRMKGVPTQLVNYAASMLQIREGEDDFNQLFIDASKANSLKQFIDEYSDAINDIDLIFGQPKNASIHAAGVVITPSDNGMTIYDWMPTKLMDGVLISEWEGPELESAGFLKEDILGIKQLDKFNDIFELMKTNGKEIPSFESIDYNDKKVLELFRKGWNQDLFHFGSVGLTSYSQDVKPDSFEELIAMIALYRPGVMEFGAHESYVKIKQKKKEPEYHWGTEEILKETKSLMIYQESVMKICQQLGGFSLATTDDIRKAMGKKMMDKLKSYEEKFISGAVERGCPAYEAKVIWNKMEAFGSYAFNKSHSAAYAMTGYFCQYLKYYFPMEFWTVSLQYAEEDEIPQRISEIRKFKGITILPPDINHSQRTFTSNFKTDTIYWSLGKIKFAGETAINALMEEREKNGQFFDIKEFALRINKTKVNKRVVTNLILSGCFDQLHNVEVPYQRREILKEFLKEDFPPEYETRDLFFWFVKQKQISQSGYYDYGQAVANSMIAFAPQRYLQPDRILVMENIDKVAIVAGLLTEVLVKKSKKGEFAQLIIDHNNEIVEATLWNESWNVYKSELQRSIGRGVIVLGKVTADRYKKHNIIHSTEETVVEIF